MAQRTVDIRPDELATLAGRSFIPSTLRQIMEANPEVHHFTLQVTDENAWRLVLWEAWEIKGQDEPCLSIRDVAEMPLDPDKARRFFDLRTKQLRDLEAEAFAGSNI